MYRCPSLGRWQHSSWHLLASGPMVLCVIRLTSNRQLTNLTSMFVPVSSTFLQLFTSRHFWNRSKINTPSKYIVLSFHCGKGVNALRIKERVLRIRYLSINQSLSVWRSRRGDTNHESGHMRWDGITMMRENRDELWAGSRNSAAACVSALSNGRSGRPTLRRHSLICGVCWRGVE